MQKESTLEVVEGREHDGAFSLITSHHITSHKITSHHIPTAIAVIGGMAPT